MANEDIIRLEDTAEPDPTIEEMMAEPKTVSGDQGTHTARDMRDVIEADRYVEAKKSGRSAIRQLYGQRYIPPGPRG